MANALHRKANRSDIDELLQTKADVQELRSMNVIIENKADLHQYDEFMKILDLKTDK